MAKCKICEENILEDKLGAHSEKCKEVEELKVELAIIRSKMQNYEERANLMKNSLETNAARQRRFHQKKPSRGAVPGDLNSPGLKTSTKDSFSSHCASNLSGDGEQGNSEDDGGTPSLMSRGFSMELAEPIKKMSLEEYNKFIEEVKKSIFALRKVMGFANKVVEKYLALGQLDDPDRIAENEIEIIYEQIVDSKVSEFIHNFKQDLASYIDKKAKYMTSRNKLIQIGGYDKVIEDVKEKFKATKSASYRKNGVVFNKLPIAPTKFKEDDALAKEHSKSPGLKKKPVGVKGGTEFASPFIGKKTLNRQIGVSGPLQSPLLAALSGFPSKSNLMTGLATTRGAKPEVAKIFLQNNSNHIGASMFKRKEDDGVSMRDKIKNVVIHKIDLTERNEIKIKSPQYSSSVASSPNGSPKMIMNSLVNSPALSSLLSPNLSKLQYKEKVAQKKSRFSVNSGFFANFKGAANADTPTKGDRSEAQKNFTSAANAVQGPTKAKKRSVSMDLLKSLHNEEKVNSQFPSLLLSGISTVASPPHKDSGGNSPKNFFNESPEKSRQSKTKKKRVEECVDSWESPSMKGYYSDSNQKNNKSQMHYNEINQVTLKDFKFIKFLGKGAYGTVWLVEKIATGDHYALKLVETANSFTQNRETALKLEKDIYERLDGDFVVKAIWTFRHEDYICFVTEYMVGGDFNKLIDKVGRLDNDQAQFYFAELVLAVESLHAMNIVHRDLKPDNILLDAKGHIRLTDFGLSEIGLNILRGNSTPSAGGRRSAIGSPAQGLENSNSQKNLALFDKLNKLKDLTSNKGDREVRLKSTTKKKGEAIFNFLDKDSTLLDVKGGKLKRQETKEVNSEKKVRIVGTPDYMAPEIVNFEKANAQSLNDKCLDFWSLGAILYEFCVGVPPFNDETREAIFDNILNLRITWPDIGYEEDCITPEAKDLITQLLNPDPKKRLGSEGIHQIKSHVFFKNFNWEGIREREAPIIPCLLEESMDTEESSKTKDEETIKHPFSDAEGKKPKKSEQANNQNEADFRMVKIKVLHQMNQDYVKKLEKQKSISSKMC